MSLHDIKTYRLDKKTINCNFVDIAPLLSEKQVLVASERCLFCYDAPCIKACPTAIDIPLFIREINTDNVQGAAKEILAANILGGSCARVCPTEVLCEKACVRNTKESAPVNISGLQRYAVDNLDTDMPYPFKRDTDTGKHVAIVGAGPAGLSCAHRLARFGHKITIYDAVNKPGGLNEYGIAEYKLVDDYAQKEIDFIMQIGGIEIKQGIALGKDISLVELRKNYDAVFIGIGMSDVNNLNIVGENANGVEDAVDYIAKLRQSANLAELPVGRMVIVIGAGMTAIDIAVQSKKLGAEKVAIIYRGTRATMSASNHEQQLALQHGVEFIFNAQPQEILTDAKGVIGVAFNKTEFKNGKLIITDQIIKIPCDSVFKAIGQKFEARSFGSSPPKLNNRNRIVVNDQFESSISGVFAGGDCIDGKNLVVEAVDHGNKAALSIHQQITNNKGD